MPQTSALYSAARIRVLEKTLLNHEHIERLIEGSVSDDMRMLSEWGYGSASDKDFEARIKSKLTAAKAIVDELTVNTCVTNVFLMEHDVNNLKLLIKLRLQKADLNHDALSDLGTVAPKLMQLMVKSWEFPELPEVFGVALKELDEVLAKPGESINPQIVSSCVDNAYYTYALSIKDKFVHEYFSAKCDFLNVVALLRAKQLNFDDETFCRMCVPHGEISVQSLLEAYVLIDANRKKSLDKLTFGVTPELKNALIKGFTSAASVEREMRTYLIALCRVGKTEMETVAPLVGYYMASVRESQCVRMIITLKRNGVPDSKIIERLGEMYG